MTYEIKVNKLESQENTYTVELFDAMGRSCYRQQTPVNGKINTSALPTGIYYLRIVQTSLGGSVSANRIIFIQR